MTEAESGDPLKVWLMLHGTPFDSTIFSEAFILSKQTHQLSQLIFIGSLSEMKDTLICTMRVMRADASDGEELHGFVGPRRAEASRAHAVDD